MGYWCAPTISSEQCVFIGDSAGYRNVQGNVLSGKITNAIAIGYGARINGSNEIQLGGSGQTLYAPTAVNIRSDARDKTDIAPLDIGLDFVKKLRPVTGVYGRRKSAQKNCGSGGGPQPKTDATKKTASSIGLLLKMLLH